MLFQVGWCHRAYVRSRRTFMKRKLVGFGVDRYR
jgi:hypothetical protein